MFPVDFQENKSSTFYFSDNFRKSLVFDEDYKVPMKKSDESRRKKMKIIIFKKFPAQQTISRPTPQILSENLDL